MKICVIGAGAIGGHVAARLIAAGRHEVSVVARGDTLKAIRSHGIRLRSAGQVFEAKPGAVTDAPSSLPRQDLVIVAVKAPALAPLAEVIAALLAPDGCALFLVNGIPWWWHYGRAADPRPLPLLDPEGTLWRTIGPERALGSCVYSSNELDAPAVINHTANNRWLLGEPGGSASSRLRAAVDTFNEAGMAAEATSDIQREIWRKNVLTSAANPASALTRLDFYELGEDPQTRALLSSLMRESLAVGAALGIDLRAQVDVDKIARRDRSRAQQRPHSMLWDVLTGRPLEVEALLGQTQAFAREHAVPTPTIDVVVTLLRGLDRADRYCGFNEKSTAPFEHTEVH